VRGAVANTLARPRQIRTPRLSVYKDEGRTIRDSIGLLSSEAIDPGFGACR